MHICINNLHVQTCSVLFNPSFCTASVSKKRCKRTPLTAAVTTSTAEAHAAPPVCTLLHNSQLQIRQSMLPATLRVGDHQYVTAEHRERCVASKVSQQMRTDQLAVAEHVWHTGVDLHEVTNR